MMLLYCFVNSSSVNSWMSEERGGFRDYGICASAFSSIAYSLLNNGFDQDRDTAQTLLP